MIVNAPRYVTNDTLHRDLNIPYVRNEIKRLSQRYVHEMEEHANILATNLVKEAYATGHMLFKTSINCQIYY